ncbi:oxidoreductase, short chain dehydrogenase/reductase family protein, partial [Oesophagostomum dentatum]
LGRALAFELHKRGAKVILTARSIDKLKEICEELKKSNSENPHEPSYSYLDVSEPEDVESLKNLAIDGKTIHLLVNNAGLSMRGSVHDTAINIYKQLMDVNFFGHVAVTQKLMDAIPDDGCIIATSSVQGKLPIPYRSAYGASKHAFQAFFDSLRCESRPNLHILTVSAGYMNTGFGSRALDAQGRPVGKEDANQLKFIIHCTISELGTGRAGHVRRPPRERAPYFWGRSQFPGERATDAIAGRAGNQ